MPQEKYFLLICTLLSRRILVSAFQLKTGADFVKCTEKVYNWTASGTTFNSSPIFKPDPTHPGLLTLQGCEQICGKGFQFRPFKDLILRFSIWIIPAIVLVFHFTFPPLGFKNMVSVINHMIGDPIDSVWSLLMRQESLLRVCGGCMNQIGQPRDDEESRTIAPDIRVIWCAYEEVCCQPPPESFFGAFNSHVFSGSEKDLIRNAATNLSLNRSDPQSNSLVAVAVLLVAMVIAYMRTRNLIGQSTEEIAHTIAVMALLFYLLPLVLISGTMGTFASPLIPVREIRKLHQSLPEIFPALEFEIQKWPGAACWTGLNSCWRPQKAIGIEWSGRRRHFSPPLLLFIAFSFVIFGSYTPALFLAASNYRAIGYGRLGFACRSTSWTVIASLWLLSVIIDFCFPREWEARSLWISVRRKDGIIAALITCIVLTVQVGFFNNCWCQSNWLSSRSNAVVVLLPLNSHQMAYAWMAWISIPVGVLVLVLGLTAFFIWRGWELRRLFHKNREELQGSFQEEPRLPPPTRGRSGSPDGNATVELQDLSQREPPRGLQGVVGIRILTAMQLKRLVYSWGARVGENRNSEA